jgi:D-alanyl-D-alanine carboxypeptidase/D-alanyl-D-alanine-endopeptidase (penicillin-binding protein 4)
VLPATTGVLTGSTASQNAALVAAVTAALKSPALGSDVAVSVVDVVTGATLLARGDARPQKPASTLKLLTGIAVLRALGPDARLSTRVVQGATPRDLVLVGGGDATLTRVPTTSTPAGQAARPTSMAALVAATVKALKAASRGSVTVQVDDSLFTGPRTASGWPAAYTASGIIAPVSALSVDQGARSTGATSRSSDPALAAGAAFVAGLKAAGISVLGPVTRVTAPATAAAVAAVQSPTISQLVERMLTNSDDALAEALAHLAGGKLAGDASFAGGAAATVSTLNDLGVRVDGVSLHDGSGLSLQNLVPTSTLVGALAAVALDKPANGETTGVLWPVSTGMPVAGVTGTLATRFDASGTAVGRGVVRAKTGTLTGVDCLAGVVRSASGRLLAFAVLADATPGPQSASRTALDRAASAVATG